MTLPETSLEREMQRRIAAIDAVTAYCGVEEGRSYRCRRPSCHVRGGVPTIVKAEGQARLESDIALR